MHRRKYIFLPEADQCEVYVDLGDVSELESEVLYVHGKYYFLVLKADAHEFESAVTTPWEAQTDKV